MQAKSTIKPPGLPIFVLDDLITALGLSGIGIVLIILGPGNEWFGFDHVPDMVAQPVLVICGFLGTLYAPHTRFAAASFVIGLGVDVLAGGHDFSLWLIFQLIFVLVGHASRAIASWVFRIAFAATLIAGIAAFSSGVDASTAFQITLLAGLILFVPALWASNVREHQHAAEAESERAQAEHERAEAERSRADAQAETLTLDAQNAAVNAKIAEQKTRSAAAEDLHDLVAGHISAIALQSQAALATDDGPIRTRVLGTIHESADRALIELRRMIEVLRTDLLEPDSGRTTVTETLDLARSLGIDVTGAADLPALAQDQEAALRPVFAEIIANVMKHARTKSLELSSPRLGVITAANPAHDTDSGQPGQGLHNIRDRLDRLGGGAHFTRGHGMFTVTLELPIDTEGSR